MSKKKERTDRIATPFGIYLPTRVPFAGVWYTVENKPLEMGYGLCDKIEKRIVIDVASCKTAHQLLVVWRHECGHAIEEEYSIRDVADEDTDRYAHGHTEADLAFVAVQ